MPFKDTPGLRRLVAQALAEEDRVTVRVLPARHFHVVGVRDYGPGETFELPRVRARKLIEADLKAIDGECGRPKRWRSRRDVEKPQSAQPVGT